MRIKNNESRSYSFNEAIETDWNLHIQEHNVSGLSVLEYCRRNKLNYQRFRYWRQKLLKTPYNSKAQHLKFVEIKGSSPIISRVTQSIESPASLRLWFGDYCIEVNENFSPSRLSEIVDYLERQR